MKGFLTGTQPNLGSFLDYASLNKMKLCDIGVNILDKMFYGEYNHKYIHENDINNVIDRANSLSVQTLICTGSNIEDSKKLLHFCSNYENNTGLYCTAGIHPCNSNIFENVDNISTIMNDLNTLVKDGLNNHKLVAIGECGLDYDRLEYCNKETQLISFENQLQLACNYELPLFLHNRNTNGDFLNLMKTYRSKIIGGGVVHSYTDSLEEMKELIDLDLYIGINGCSLRTEEGLLNAAAIPDHLLLIETDAPWCGIKKTHPSYQYITSTFETVKKEKYKSGSMIKDRNEPCTLIQILEVLSKIRNCHMIDLAEQIYSNTEKLFPSIK